MQSFKDFQKSKKLISTKEIARENELPLSEFQSKQCFVYQTNWCRPYIEIRENDFLVEIENKHYISTRLEDIEKRVFNFIN